MLIPSLQQFFLVAEDIPPPLLISCASAMHIPLKIDASPGGRNPTQGVNHDTHLRVKLSLPLEKKYGGRGSETKPALCVCGCVQVCTHLSVTLQFSGFS